MNLDKQPISEQKRRLGAALFHESEAPFSEIDEEVDDDELIRYADGTLRGRERNAIAAACRTNIAAAMITAEFVQEYSEVRHLAWGWMGWKGAILSATGRLSLETAQAWDEHLTRDSISRQQTVTARRLLGSFAWRPAPALRFAANAMALLVFFGIGYSARNFSQKPLHSSPLSKSVKPPLTPNGGNSSKGLGVGGGNDLPGPEDIEQRTQAKDTNDLEELGYRIEDLEAVRDKYPQVAAYQELLLPMYLKCASLEQDPAKRRVWNLKAQAALQFIHSHSPIISE